MVPSTRLVDILWPDGPPSSARALIQTYVSQLRRALGQHGGADLISTQATGYLTRVPPGSADVVLFEQLMDNARQATQPQARVEALSRAPALWRGPVLARLGQTGLWIRRCSRCPRKHKSGRTHRPSCRRRRLHRARRGDP